MAEKKNEKRLGGLFWLIPVAAFLVVGGLIAFVSMRDAAEKLAGRPQSGDMSSSGGVAAAGRGGAMGARDFFSSDENIPDDALASYDSHRESIENRLYEKPSTGKVTAFSGGAASGASGAGTGQGEEAKTPSSRSGGASGPAPRLTSGLASKGAAGASAKSSLGAAGASSFGGQGNRPAVVASATGQTGTGGGASRSGAGGVIDSLRSAWRGSVTGAREASNDAARTLLARSFDGSPASERLSLEYDEKMKRELDVVDPNSIPKFLRDQDLSADRASAYDVPGIKDLKVDRAGTEAALKEDKAYQEKLASMASGMLNPMFSGLANTNGPGGAGGPDEKGAPPGGDDAPGLFSIPDTPQDDEWMNNLYNQDIIDTTGGCGEECGCTCEAPCCCLPDDYFGGGMIGDFPPLDTSGGIWV